jgi:hypothetical protein
MLPEELAKALPTIRARCEEIGRDPATLAISVHVWGSHVKRTGQTRVDRLAAYRALGVDRVMTLRRDSATTDEALESLAEDARAAGAELD